MLNIIFAIILIFVTIGEIYMVFSALDYSTIAGNASHFCFVKIHSTKRKFNTIKVDGQPVNVSQHMSLIVCGNSMKKYEVRHGMRIYVKTYMGNDYDNIQDRPILLIKNKHRMWLSSKYKLRKFIGYVDTVDGETIYDKYKSEIDTISKNVFIEDIRNTVKKMKDTSGNMILSETFDVDLNRNRYSLHHSSNVVGEVEYAC